MWYLVFKKRENADVTLYQDEQTATLIAKASNAPKQSFSSKERALKRANQLGYSVYFDDYVSPVTTAKAKPPEVKEPKPTKKQKKRKKRGRGNYQKYLRSEEWKMRREQRLKIDNYTCQMCGTKEKLVVHHKTYARIFNEDMDDLITLCDPCHKKVHNRDNIPQDNFGSQGEF